VVAVLTVLAVAAVYLAVWPHELGHSLAAYLYGCKADPWRTETRWYLAGSRAGVIDEGCLARQGGHAVAVTAIAGIAVNLLLAALAHLLGRWWLPGRTARGGIRWGLIVTVVWASANAAEALSYLVINTVWLQSDMEVIVRHSGLGRWPWAAVGLLLAAVAALGLSSSTQKAAQALAGPGASERLWRWAFAAYAFAVGLAAVVSRALL
jgi:hypothetical protein